MHSHGKRPTRRQKELIEAVKLDPADWLVVKDLLDEMHIRHRVYGKVKVLPKSMAMGILRRVGA